MRYAGLLIGASIGVALVLAVFQPDPPFGETGPVTPAPVPVTIVDRLKNKTNKEKANIKGREIAKIKTLAQTQRKGYKIQILDTKAIEGGVEVFARAWDANGQIGFGKDGTVDIERFVLINPPILVDDPAGDIIREFTDFNTGELKQRPLRADAKEAVLQTLAHTIKVKQQKFDSENIVVGKIGNTTLTVHPAAGANAPVDGFVSRINGGESFTNQVNNAGTGNNEVNHNGPLWQMQKDSGSTWGNLYRSVFGFDTSSIGTDTVDSATLSIYGESSVNESSIDFVGVIDSNPPASDDALENGDYNIAGWAEAKQSDTEIAISAWSTIAYNDFPLNATGLATIDPDGNSWYGGRSGRDFDDATYSGTSTGDNEIMWFADEEGTTKDPKLVVEHSAAAPAAGAITPIFLQIN